MSGRIIRRYDTMRVALLLPWWIIGSLSAPSVVTSGHICWDWFTEIIEIYGSLILIVDSSLSHCIWMASLLTRHALCHVLINKHVYCSTYMFGLAFTQSVLHWLQHYKCGSWLISQHIIIVHEQYKAFNKGATNIDYFGRLFYFCIL